MASQAAAKKRESVSLPSVIPKTRPIGGSELVANPSARDRAGEIDLRLGEDGHPKEVGRRRVRNEVQVPVAQVVVEILGTEDDVVGKSVFHAASGRPTGPGTTPATRGEEKAVNGVKNVQMRAGPAVGDAAGSVANPSAPRLEGPNVGEPSHVGLQGPPF